MVSLKQAVTLLHYRIKAGIEQKLCWDRMVAETSSELVVRATRIFLDSVNIGGEAERVGRDAGIFALKISLLRGKRATVASGFLWLTGVMHIVMVALVLFIYETMLQFTGMIANIFPEGGMAVPGLPGMGIYGGSFAQMGLLHFMVIGIVLVLTIANAAAVYAAAGGHHYKLFFYLAVTSLISGGMLLGVQPVVTGMFKMIGGG
jgi:archaeal flagellar protein FlaJ